MINEFYKKALPSSGVYCVAAIDPIKKIPSHKFVESIDDIESAVTSSAKCRVSLRRQQMLREYPRSNFHIFLCCKEHSITDSTYMK